MHWSQQTPSSNKREDSTHGHHQMVNTQIRLIIFLAAKDGEALYSQKKQDQELTGSDHEFLIAKFRLKLKKVGKTTRPFRYDLNQIPHDYTVEVRNRFKGLDLIECLMSYECSWHCTGDRDQDHPCGKEMQKSQMAVWGGLKKAVKREVKSKG